MMTQILYLMTLWMTLTTEIIPTQVTLLANATKQQKTWTQPHGADLPAGDLHKVLSNTNEGYPILLPLQHQQKSLYMVRDTIVQSTWLTSTVYPLHAIVNHKHLLLTVVQMMALQVMMCMLSRR
jgi:hypothetical protein